MKRFVATRVFVSLVVFALCAFATISLVTFRTSDLATFTMPPASPAYNACGHVGAQIGAFLFEGLGVCSYVLILLLSAWAGLNLFGKGLDQIALRTIGAALLMVCACTFAAGSGKMTASMPGHGGAVGVALNSLVVQYFGQTGQWFLGSAITMMALLLLSVDELLVPPVAWIGRTGKEHVMPLLRRRKPRSRGTRAAAGTAKESSIEVAAEHDTDQTGGTDGVNTNDVTQTEVDDEVPSRSPDEPVDTGRPLTAGYLGRISQADRKKADKKAPKADGEAASGESEVDPDASFEFPDELPTEASSPEDDAEEATGAAEAAEADEARNEEQKSREALIARSVEASASGPSTAEGNADEDSGKEEEDLPAKARAPRNQNYLLPSLNLLDEYSNLDKSVRSQHIQQQIEILERTLREFGVGAKVVDIDQGPVVTRYELSLEAGTKLSKVTSLSDDLAIACKAPAVRIVAPIPGKSTIGVELPNLEKELVRMRELVESDVHRKRDITIPLFLGKDASGRPIVSDLTKMPHLLIARATGSGKSVCINSIIASVLMTQHPDDVRLILIDPKMVEMTSFAEIPHLLTPVVTDMKPATWILDWATRKMDERYDILASVGVRSISAYNRLGEEEIRTRLGEDVDYERVPFHLPYIIIIVDELADMMMLASKNIETSITRLAQKSRAVGLHIILATQRPSVDVITGLIKSNLPTRISFQVTSKVDSRTILDRNGAEKLLGSGDFLYLPPGSGNLLRAQGTFMSDEEIREIVGFCKKQAEPDFNLNLDGCGGATDAEDPEAGGEGGEGYSGDDLYEDACRIVLASGRGSVSLLQRKLEIGYTRAARLVDMMAAEGIVGDYKGSKAREVVMNLDEWEAKHGRPSAGPSAPRPPATVDEHFDRLDDAADDDGDDD